MKPTHKSYQINQTLNAILGVDREQSISDDVCVFCKKNINPNTEFRDEISKREFTISGICQSCQDKTFGT